MRSTWPFLAATAVLGIGLGTWIAGLPSSEGSISVAGDLTPGSIVPEFDPARTVPIGPTTVPPAITVTPAGATTEPPRQPLFTGPPTSPPASSDATTAATTTVPATTVPPATTAAPTTTTTAAPTTTTPTTTAPPTTVATVTLLDRSQVRLVVGNGDGRWNLVGANVARLEPLGYTQIDQTDLTRRYDRTILYVRPGFEDEAARLAADLLVPGALIEPLPATPVTINDELGDVIVVLGPDAVR